MNDKRVLLKGMAVLLTAAGMGLAGCGDDTDSGGGGATESSCFYECGGMTSCMSGPMVEADCISTAESDCGGTPDNIEFQSGCSCPGWGDPNECTSPPTWYQ